MLTLITLKFLHSLFKKGKIKKQEQLRRIALLRNKLYKMKRNRESIYHRFVRGRKLKYRKTYYYKKNLFNLRIYILRGTN